MTVKHKNFEAMKSAIDDCAAAMGYGVEADRSALMRLVGDFYGSLAAVIDGYEYAAADLVHEAGDALENAVFNDMKDAVDEEQYAPRQTRQYSTLYAVNGHVVG